MIVTRLQDTSLIYKNSHFLYISSKQVEFEIKDKIPFTLAPPKNEILRYKSNKIYTRPIWGKLQNSGEYNQRTK